MSNRCQCSRQHQWCSAGRHCPLGANCCAKQSVLVHYWKARKEIIFKPSRKGRILFKELKLTPLNEIIYLLFRKQFSKYLKIGRECCRDWFFFKAALDSWGAATYKWPKHWQRIAGGRGVWIYMLCTTIPAYSILCYILKSAILSFSNDLSQICCPYKPNHPFLNCNSIQK